MTDIGGKPVRPACLHGFSHPWVEDVGVYFVTVYQAGRPRRTGSCFLSLSLSNTVSQYSRGLHVALGAGSHWGWPGAGGQAGRGHAHGLP